MTVSGCPVEGEGLEAAVKKKKNGQREGAAAAFESDGLGLGFSFFILT